MKKIHAKSGCKWVLLNEKTVYIDKCFKTYGGPSSIANALVTYSPQTLTVIEKKVLGLESVHQWMNIQKEAKYLYRVFFTYDIPNFLSRVFEKFVT